MPRIAGASAPNSRASWVDAVHEHCSDRLLGLDAGMAPEEMLRLSEEVLARNLHLIDGDEDYWITQRVTRGVEVIGAELNAFTDPTVIVECTPLPLKARAHLFRDGIEVVVPARRRTPPEALSPRAKTHNYLNLILADREAKAGNPNAWAILVDGQGNLTEGMGSNVFLVDGGRLCTPRLQQVLGGVSRETAMELAAKLEIPCGEADLSLYDAYNADEAFITSTSLCICPVRSFNGNSLREPRMPGPVTARLIDAFAELVAYDFYDQYLKRLES